jgi:hypothetical protein
LDDDVKTHYFTVGDIGSRLSTVLRDPDGQPIDLTGLTVTANLLPPNRVLDTITLSLTGTGADGAVHYDWLTGELDQAGRWMIEYVVDSELTVFEVENMVVRQGIQGVVV